MGRHRLPNDRRRSSVALAALGAPAAAVFFSVSGSAHTSPDPSRVGGGDAPCCVQVVAASPAALSSARAGLSEPMAASRMRVVHEEAPQALPPGKAPERGLQVKTILASRTISAVFPEIQSIGGVRPDALRWHPNGLALDVMIPNPGSAEGIALGNQIVAFVLKNADRFGLQDAIWRGTYYTPAGPQGSGYGHYDHVHITTTGGGYPTGGEVYIR
ncbi:hypothetical protein [Mycobacterium shimoidei]|uniref:hypothetical protein n=1 Tax=Mycobacterium shimoidei TaxID=29313 RepID=UPI0008490ED0|nr:hypothetical protein [Mycobacterium shimoidei]MCV7257604.1 hypothetical protein [Mycobacterium shimoidei]ODR13483.1 hypothetical protein BHQ16_10695 [Mycobacterium shimoidei]ORW81631.1 hypothetical protein AWC26_08360 [Mycobacterium shimoidei]